MNSVTRFQILDSFGDVFDTIFRGATRQDAEEALATWARCGYDTTDWTIVEATIADDRSGW